METSTSIHNSLYSFVRGYALFHIEMVLLLKSASQKFHKKIRRALLDQIKALSGLSGPFPTVANQMVFGSPQAGLGGQSFFFAVVPQ